MYEGQNKSSFPKRYENPLISFGTKHTPSTPVDFGLLFVTNKHVLTTGQKFYLKQDFKI